MLLPELILLLTSGGRVLLEVGLFLQGIVHRSTHAVLLCCHEIEVNCLPVLHLPHSTICWQ